MTDGEKIATTLGQSFDLVGLSCLHMLAMAQYNLDHLEMIEICYGKQISEFHPDYVEEKLGYLQKGGLLSLVARLDFNNRIGLYSRLWEKYGLDAFDMVRAEMAHWLADKREVQP